MHVVQPFSAFSAELTVNLPAYEHELLACCSASLEKVLQERAGKEFQIHKILKIGRPAEEIVRFAAEERWISWLLQPTENQSSTILSWLGGREGHQDRALSGAGAARVAVKKRGAL